MRREPPPLHDSPSLCLQLRVIRAFKSTLEDLEERRSVHSLHSLHSLRSSRSHPGPRPLSDISYIDEDPLKTPSSPLIDRGDNKNSSNHSSSNMMKMISPAEDPHLVPTEKDYLGAGLVQQHGHISLPAVVTTADTETTLYCSPSAYTTTANSSTATAPPYVLITCAAASNVAATAANNQRHPPVIATKHTATGISVSCSSPPSSNPLSPLLQHVHAAPSSLNAPTRIALANKSQQQKQQKSQVPLPPPRKALYQPLSPLHLQNVSPQTTQRNIPPQLPDLPKLVHETSI